MERKKPYFLLYAHNQVVEGQKRAAIYDLKLARVFYIPKVLVGILQEMRTSPLSTIIATYAADQPQALLQYIDFFLEHDLGFYVDDPLRYPTLPLTYHYPGLLQNAIVLSDLQAYDLGNVLKQLPPEGCRFLSLFIELKQVQDLGKIKQALDQLKDTVISTIQLFMKHHEALSRGWLKTLFVENKKLAKITVWGAAETGATIDGPIEYSALGWEALVAPDSRQLILNIPFFSEAIRFHPYFHQKVVVDWAGYIKNGVSERQHFGHIECNRLGDVIASPAFQALWKRNADQLFEWQEDELRYAYFTNCTPAAIPSRSAILL
ncbi:MAG: hypothetical protein R2828_21635 [Saprospiraceae bacterium]